jgi:hypothetical protein
MSSIKKKKQLTDIFRPLPWDGDPRIHWVLCLEAIDNDDMRLPARYLLETEFVDQRILRALADKLDLSDRKISKFVLKKTAGRPRKGLPPTIDDPLGMAMESGDLKNIADYLRHTPAPDRRILLWLADRLDPVTVDGPHFVVKQPRGKRPRQSQWETRIAGEQARLKMLGMKVERRFREAGKLEAALHHFSQKNEDWLHPMSRSTARRAHDAFLKARSRARKP